MNVTATEAHRRNLVDLVAADEQELVRELDGFRVQGPKAQRLETTGARIDSVGVPFKFAALELLVNPNTVFLLLTIGLILIGLELFNPGMILPGTLGGVSLILALFGLAQLPINVGGAAADPARIRPVRRRGLRHQPRRPRRERRRGARVRWPAAVRHRQRGVRHLGAGGAADRGGAGRLSSCGSSARRCRRAIPQVHTGSEELIGAHGEVRSPLAPLGHVFVKGALWRARSERGGSRVGDEVVVENVDGLTLTVAPGRPEA